MDNRFYVSLEAARLLKEKGYNEECTHVIWDDGDISEKYNLNQDIEYMCQFSCPTKAEAIDWLESKGMCIVVVRRTINNEVGWRYVIYGQTEIISGFNTRLEAEEAAIIKALKLLNGKEE